jgi:hypothetical protein
MVRMQRRTVSQQRHKDRLVVDAKLQRLRRNEPHTAPLVQLVNDMRAAGGAGCIVPDVDPEFGGVDARALVLLNHPIRTTSRRHQGSGLLSLDNADQTAANSYAAYEAVGLDRRYTLHWNASPWMDQDAQPLDLGVQAAITYTSRLVELLHDLRIVVLLGSQTQRYWPRLVAARPRFTRIPTASSWSPGPPGINMPGRMDDLIQTLRYVRDVVE